MRTPRAVVAHHASTQSAQRRRELGSHATPGPLARTLVDLAIVHLAELPALVVDPSCGAGSFLLAAADALADRGLGPDDVLGRLAGCDVDPQAVASCGEALRVWGRARGAQPDGSPDLRVTDPLRFPTPWGGRVDLVVGNPPFLAQRTADTARDGAARSGLRHRFGALGPYVDASAAFLLVATELLDRGGVAVMLQPQSILSARDAGAVRDRVVADAELVSLWADDTRYFDAEIDVCAPVLRRATTARSLRGPVDLRWGANAAAVGSVAAPGAGSAWASLLAAGLGVPAVPDVPTTDAGRTLDDVATTTAGFREEFYALASAARSVGEQGWAPTAAPLVTVGMVDVARMDRMTPRRLGGRRVSDPRLDTRALQEASPRVAAWVLDRSVPKVLVATQTRVLEAAADPSGRCVPVTPLVSVEPRSGAGVDVWHLLALLSAPPVAARIANDAAGSGLSVGAVRVSAASLRSIPLPVHADAWSTGASLIRDVQQERDGNRSERLRDVGAVMCEAYGVAPDGELLEWWHRHASRVRPSRA